MPVDKRGVIVVHGIGDQRPGGTVKEFADSYAAYIGGQSLNPGEVHWYQEAGEALAVDVVGQKPTRKAKKFPSFRHHVTVGDNNIIFSEVYWADLSPTPSGIVGAIQGFLWVLFGLRHIIREAVAAPGVAWAQRLLLKALRGLSSAITWLIFGPISGVNLFLLVTVVLVAASFGLSDVFGLENWVQKLSGHQFSLVAFVNDYSVPLLSLLGVISAGVGMSSWQALRLRGWPRRTLFWWIAFSLIVAAAAPVIKVFFEAQALRLVNATLDNVRALDAVSFGLLVVELVLAIWVIVALLLALQYFISVIGWFSMPRFRRAIELAYSSTFLIAAFYWIAITIVWMFTVQNISSNEFVRSTADVLVARGLNPSGFSWLVLAVMIGLFMLVGVRRWWWMRKHKAAKAEDSAAAIVRLIVSPAVVHFINLVSLAGIVLLTKILVDAAVDIGEFFGVPLSLSPLQSFAALFDLNAVLSPVLAYVAHVSSATLVLTGFLILLMVLFMTKVETGLGLLIDITNHFRLGKPPVMTALREDGLAKGIRTAVTPVRGDYFPLRERIIQRIETVIEDMIEQEGVSRVTVVAHSQGTVFAIMALERNPEIAAGRPLRLITMGSPFSHLYQHYFPGRYGGDAAARLPKVERWVNIFRIDDFVGTKINGQMGKPLNFAVKPGGHTGYWSDPEVLEIIRREAPL